MLLSVEQTLQQVFLLPLLAQALRDAHRKGVDVRIVTENTNNYLLSDLGSMIPDASDYEVGRLNDYFAYADLNSDKALSEDELNQMDALKIIKEAGIPIVDDTEDGSKGSGLMHHKFMVLDDEQVLTGSGNYTWSDFHGDRLQDKSRGNANNFLKIKNRELNQAFSDEFLMMWGDGPANLKNSKFGVKKRFRAPLTVSLFDNVKVTLQFGATSKSEGWENSPNGLIASELRDVRKSFEAAFFVWSEQKLVDEIPQSIAKNVRVVIDPFFAYRFYSELLDVLGVEMLSDSCKIEAANKPWQNPALNSGMSHLSPGDLLHHKFAVLDREKVITGSHNWSANANQNNDETILVIESPLIAEKYHQEFERIFDTASLGVGNHLLNKIQEAKDKCNSLGVFNPRVLNVQAQTRRLLYGD